MRAELLGCFAMTETGHGSDVASLRTTATYDPDTDEFVIHTPDDSARKEYIGNAARDGRVAVVFAQLITGGESQGVHAFVVPIRDREGRAADGVRIEDCGLKAGLNGVDNGRLYFDHVRVPRDNLLNRYGDVDADGAYTTPIENKTKRFFTMLGTLVQGRISVAGGAGSATKVALTIAVRYGDTRRQFEAPDGEEIVVLDYLAHQRKLLPALAKTYALHFAQLDLVAGLHETTPDLDAPQVGHPADHPDRRELEARAAGIKAIATWHATATIQACREACGGAGYLAENRLPGLKADTDVFTTFEGDNTVLLQLVAKELLTDYRDHFGELDWFGTARFVADIAVDSVVERIGGRRILQRLLDAAPGRGDEDDLRDRTWHLQLFDYRETHLLDTLARRLQKAPSADDPFAVFNAAQDHLLAAARAHVDSVLLQAFVDGIERCQDGAGARAARAGLRPVRAVDRRGRARLVPGARAADRAALQSRPRRGQRTVRAGPPARPHAGRRVRRARAGDRCRDRRSLTPGQGSGMVSQALAAGCGSIVKLRPPAGLCSIPMLSPKLSDRLSRARGAIEIPGTIEVCPP